MLIILHDKTEYVIHIRNLKQALNHGLILNKVHRVINFNQSFWLKQYIVMNTKQIIIFRKIFPLMNNATFGKNHRKCEKT